MHSTLHHALKTGLAKTPKRQLPWLAGWTRECQLLPLLERQKMTRQLISEGNLSVAPHFTKLQSTLEAEVQ